MEALGVLFLLLLFIRFPFLLAQAGDYPLEGVLSPDLEMTLSCSVSFTPLSFLKNSNLYLKPLDLHLRLSKPCVYCPRPPSN